MSDPFDPKFLAQIPHLTLRAASRYGVGVPWPGQYLRGKPPAGG